MTHPTSLDGIIEAITCTGHSCATTNRFRSRHCQSCRIRIVLTAYAAREAERRKGLEALRDKWKATFPPRKFDAHGLCLLFAADITALLDEGTAAGKQVEGATKEDKC